MLRFRRHRRQRTFVSINYQKIRPGEEPAGRAAKRNCNRNSRREVNGWRKWNRENKAERHRKNIGARQGERLKQFLLLKWWAFKNKKKTAWKSQRPAVTCKIVTPTEF